MVLNVQFVFLTLSLALSTTAHAATPVMGGWHNLPIGPAFHVSKRRTPFVMLPADVAVGTRYKVLDLARWKAVCCVVVSSPRLQYDTLVLSYGVPGVWASDLGSALNDQTENEPYVFAARSVEHLASHVFEGDFNTSGEMGGLLLPADAEAVAPDKLVMFGKTYRVNREEGSLADDDGGWESYKLSPEGGGANVTVNVRYGTN